ncbi:coiled-coil domain-containing protein 103-like [Dreissena polymorpha]|uniref:coiled-coil domain-containing protein 103-like n=1 Tax=Dreissena polymorpha TaxID=45954 RepID=UPI002264438B|nr:coiled-coil domain-containing protein 103-like [Dreissena polymorpha]
MTTETTEELTISKTDTHETTAQTAKISHDDDKVIDFKKLESELQNAVEGEARYWRENDAKFRAVHQKVASYDEFRDIVLASHLLPLEKDDRLTNIKFIQPWNTQAQKKQDSGNRETTAEIPKAKDWPTSGQGFVREWRRLNKDTKQQYAYLLQIGGEQLGTIFKTEIGFGLLGEFGNCLNCAFAEQDSNAILCILQHLSTTNRFSLTVQFLSSKEKDYFNSLFRKLSESLKGRDPETDVFKDLLTKYEVKL